MARGEKQCGRVDRAEGVLATQRPVAVMAQGRDLV